MLKTGFSDEDEEIGFFKHQKPTIVAKLIYYNAVYKIEAKDLMAEKKFWKYFNKELSKLKRFFDNNMAFYSDHRTDIALNLDHPTVCGKHKFN